MLTHLLLPAWRNFTRNKGFSLINILGLALGITCSLLILLWVVDERSVDGFHANGKQLFQVYERQYYDGKVEASYPTQGLLAEELKKQIPEIRYASAMDFAAAAGSGNTFEAGEKINKMNGVFVGNDFLTMFSYPLLQGNAANALQGPQAIAISRKMAEIFFGSPQKAMGKTLRYDNTEVLQVTAVFENLPARSSRQFEFLRSWVAYVQQNDWVHKWDNTNPETFVMLSPQADPAVVGRKIKDFIYRFMHLNPGYRTELALQPYEEKYLHANFKNGRLEGGRIEYVRIFTWVAAFILLIACINFMNLATARSAKRAKEVGVRKVIGAQRGSLVRQFMGEALLLTFFAVLVALLLTSLLLPAFNELTEKQLTLPVNQPRFWGGVALLLLLTGLTAGSYPALFLSSFKPVRVLKGSIQFGPVTGWLRQGLVVFQFSLSLILIIGTLVIFRQLAYIQNKDLGYDRENLIYIPIEGELSSKYPLFKQQALNLAGIRDMTKMRSSPTLIYQHTNSISWPRMTPGLVTSFAADIVGYDFVRTMKLTLTEGRDFSRDFGTDSTAFIINETAARKMGYDQPLGQTVSWGNHQGKIIGVLKDFHFNSLHQPIEPLILHLDENWTWGTILVRSEAGKTPAALAGLEKLSRALNPKFPFTYQFSDLEYAKLYRSEQVVSQLANYFAFLAIFISCLGLFGLATFTAAQRTKEIGVRKVLGATVPDIFSLLAAKFLRLVLIAILIAFPLAWLALQQWLKNFAYRIEVSGWVFALAALVTILIALATVSYQSLKAALLNPVKSLRTE